MNIHDTLASIALALATLGLRRSPPSEGVYTDRRPVRVRHPLAALPPLHSGAWSGEPKGGMTSHLHGPVAPTSIRRALPALVLLARVALYVLLPIVAAATGVPLSELNQHAAAALDAVATVAVWYASAQRPAQPKRSKPKAKPRAPALPAPERSKPKRKPKPRPGVSATRPPPRRPAGKTPGRPPR